MSKRAKELAALERHLRRLAGECEYFGGRLADHDLRAAAATLRQAASGCCYGADQVEAVISGS